MNSKNRKTEIQRHASKVCRLPVNNPYFPFRIGYNLLAILGNAPNLGLAEKMPKIKGNIKKA